MISLRGAHSYMIPEGLPDVIPVDVLDKRPLVPASPKVMPTFKEQMDDQLGKLNARIESLNSPAHTTRPKFLAKPATYGFVYALNLQITFT